MDNTDKVLLAIGFGIGFVFSFVLGFEVGEKARSKGSPSFEARYLYIRLRRQC